MSIDMHKIFWKIFLSFWLALILFVSATLWLTSLYLEQTRGLDDDANPRAQLQDYVQQGRRVARTTGEAGLVRWLQQLDRREVIPFLLLDNNGQDLLGRDVPAAIAQRRQNHPRGFGRGFRHRQRIIELTDGRIFHLSPNYQGVTLYRMLARPRVIAIPLVIATLVSGWVCFLLARYLARPIRQLSSATRQLARGDLAVRVSPRLGQRKDEIADLAADFDHMAAHIQQLLDSHMQLIADVSHELRSPLARLHAAVGLARQKYPETVGNELDRIEREADQLNDMIGQIITMSRLESGSRSIHLQTLPLNELVQQIVDQAQIECRQKNCTIDLDAITRFHVDADDALLGSALENVLRNAVKYTVQQSTIEIGMQQTGNSEVKLSVRDHGPGVPENMLDKLFTPFFRIDPARDRNSGGFGLGLAIADRAIRAHHGSITAHNHAQGGLVVDMILPLSQQVT